MDLLKVISKLADKVRTKTQNLRKNQKTHTGVRAGKEDGTTNFELITCWEKNKMKENTSTRSESRGLNIYESTCVLSVTL